MVMGSTCCVSNVDGTLYKLQVSIFFIHSGQTYWIFFNIYPNFYLIHTKKKKNYFITNILTNDLYHLSKQPDKWSLTYIFSSPGPKGHVSFCNHFASVVVVRVCKLFIFSSSSLNPLNRFGPNFADMFIGRSSTRFVILVQIGARANNVF